MLMDIRTHRWMDGRMDGWTDRPSYRDVRTHLKTERDGRREKEGKKETKKQKLTDRERPVDKKGAHSRHPFRLLFQQCQAEYWLRRRAKRCLWDQARRCRWRRAWNSSRRYGCHLSFPLSSRSRCGW